MAKPALAIALAAAGSLAVFAVSPVAAQGSNSADDAGLASKTLASGAEDEAIIALEAERKSAPHDPGVLINLGIAYAHQGNDAKAMDLFKAAMTSPDPIELETADGNLTDSRRLARKAMRMLERGEFRPVSERLTYRE